MKKNYLLIVIIAISSAVSAQNIGIGTTTPNASALLEIKASNKGLLIPRTSTTTRITIVNPAKGLLIYDSTTSSFWFQNGGAWVQIDTSGNAWSLKGNAGTNPATNFIGTTDAKALNFKVNNTKAGFLDYSTANTSFGANALTSITSGNYNTAIGTGSVLANTAGYNNTALGSYALTTNTAGSFNIAIGSDAMHDNISGNSNSAIGFQALYNNTGDNNTATGRGALFTNTTGSHNTANGTNALVLNSSGSNNIANGEDALHYNNTGNDNIAIGLGALFFNTTGYSNIAIGTRALVNNTIASNVVAIGDSALFNNGIGAINSNGGGYSNTAIGSKALYSNTTGYSNTANGSGALYSNTTGNNNIAVGDQALYSNTHGEQNTAVGSFALGNNLGNYNTAIGFDALGVNGSGANNTAVGYYSLVYNATGNYNTALGYITLISNTTGNFNTALGYGADVSSDGLTNATAIGSYAKVGTSNTIQLGDNNVTSVNTSGAVSANGYKCKPGYAGAFRGNVFNIDWTPGGAAQLWIDVTNLGTISFTSDRRLKENIDLMKGNGIERMMELKPVHFKYKKIEGTIFSGSSQEQEGFIADELQQVIPSAVNGEKNALTSKGTIQPQTINIVPVVAVLTKAVQEQQQMIEDLKKENAEIKDQLKKLIEIVSKK